MHRREAGRLSARDACRFVREVYSLDAAEAAPIAGACHEVWHVRGIFGSFVFKRFPAAGRANAEREPELATLLRAAQVPTAAFVRANDGSFVTDCQGQPAHLQTFIEGSTPNQNEAPPWLLDQSAEMLGRLCRALTNVRGLPHGFPKPWFTFDLKRKMLEYDALIIATSRNRRLNATLKREIAADLAYKRATLAELAGIRLSRRTFTCGPTHGDYSVRQLVCSADQISAVVDLSAACRQPLIWEVLRSYSYADPACTEGALELDALGRYVGAFLSFVPLTRKDLLHAADLYYVQLVRSTYGYRQVLLEGNMRPDLLTFARWRTQLCRWLQEHRGKVCEALAELAPAPAAR